MSKTTVYATEDDLTSGSPSKKRLNFGGGLYLICTNEGHTYFQYRICVNGISSAQQLGKYPNMTLTQAREKAERLRTEVVNVRDKIAEASFKSKLAKPKVERKNKQSSCFRSAADASQFINNLFMTRISPTEVQLMLLLLMLIPSHPDELIFAKRQDFHINEECWILREAQQDSTKGRYINSHAAPLCNIAIQLVQNQFNLNRGKENFLFPDLATMPKAIRDETITKEMEAIWSSYPISPSEFRVFFRDRANKHSGFHSEFIDATINHGGKESIYDSPDYWSQKVCLANWWWDYLVKLIGKFPLMPNV